MQHEIKKLIQDIVKDYANWQGLCAANRADTCSKVQKDMFDRFKSRIDFKEGKSILKSLLKAEAFGDLLLTLIKITSFAKVISLKQQVGTLQLAMLHEATS